MNMHVCIDMYRCMSTCVFIYNIPNHLHSFDCWFGMAISRGPRKVGPLGLCRLGVWDRNQLFITCSMGLWQNGCQPWKLPGYYSDFWGLRWVPFRKKDCTTHWTKPIGWTFFRGITLSAPIGVFDTAQLHETSINSLITVKTIESLIYNYEPLLLV